MEKKRLFSYTRKSGEDPLLITVPSIQRVQQPSAECAPAFQSYFDLYLLGQSGETLHWKNEGGVAATNTKGTPPSHKDL